MTINEILFSIILTIVTMSADRIKFLINSFLLGIISSFAYRVMFGDYTIINFNKWDSKIIDGYINSSVPLKAAISFLITYIIFSWGLKKIVKYVSFNLIYMKIENFITKKTPTELDKRKFRFFLYSMLKKIITKIFNKSTFKKDDKYDGVEVFNISYEWLRYFLLFLLSIEVLKFPILPIYEIAFFSILILIFIATIIIPISLIAQEQINEIIHNYSE